MAARNGGFVGLFLVAVGVLMAASMDAARAYKFCAGGRDGWVLHPSESYQDWSSRNRFQVNDTIFFRYAKGQDSVLVVSEQHFDACDTSNPIARLDGGDSLFKFDRSGPFFFISGVAGNCQRGQKLLVVVMAVRRQRQWAQPPISLPPSSLPPTPAPVSSSAPSPAGAPPTVNPTGPSPSPSPTPSAGPPTQGPSPGGSAISPAQSPSESDTSDGGAAWDGLQPVPVFILMVVLVAATLG